MIQKDRVFPKEYARNLLNIAEGDFHSAKSLAKSKDGRPENVCFLAQQSVEKSLKAVLCWIEQPIPLVHDLGILVGRIPVQMIPEHGYDLTVLSPYGTIRRYEEGVPPSQDDLHAAVKLAEEILVWAKKAIK